MSITLHGFEEKWLAAYPEFAMALRFLSEDQRRKQTIFGCLVFELEQAAFHIHEPLVAVAKLNWWAEEFSNCAAGSPRHPITRTLNEQWDDSNEVAWHYQTVITGALTLQENKSATNLAEVLDQYDQFYTPLAKAEAALFSRVNATHSSRALTLARTLRACTTLEHSDTTALPLLPLNLLARHQLTRTTLSTPNASRAAALHEHLNNLWVELDQLLRTPAHLSLLRLAGLSADRWRAGKAARATEPVATLGKAMHLLPLRTVFLTWRTAQRIHA